MATLGNMPKIKMGLVGVSRDCFPRELTQKRLKNVAAACRRLHLNPAVCKVMIESEKDALGAVEDMRAQGVNAVTIYLGNFGPEGPETIFAQKLGVPFMLVAAAEESKDSLIDGRGDALCGMLNASFNVGLRGLRAYIPPVPVGLPDAVAKNVQHFIDVARVVVGVKNLKVFAFGPRPQDFYACNAPIKPLYDLGVEVMENSELDLFLLHKAAAGMKREIGATVRSMKAELGLGNKHPEKLEQLAQFEVALMKFYAENLGSRGFGVFADKCWPSFEPAFGFTPCYVNSRLATRGIPVACEVDIYGVVSEYMAQLASLQPVTILDVNNSVPQDVQLESVDLGGAALEDLMMAFHCGNTASCHLCPGYSMQYQLIMHRLMEPGKAPDITCGTLEGRLKPGPTTMFRLQATPNGAGLMSYVAQGEILDAEPNSFGAIGIFAIPGFQRFYRYIMLERQFPHHTAVAFSHAGRVLFDAARLLGICDLNAPLPASVRYPGENPF